MQLNLIGVTVEPDRRYIHFPSNKFMFAPVAVAEKSTPTQVMAYLYCRIRTRIPIQVWIPVPTRKRSSGMCTALFSSSGWGGILPNLPQMQTPLKADPLWMQRPLQMQTTPVGRPPYVNRMTDKTLPPNRLRSVKKGTVMIRDLSPDQNLSLNLFNGNSFCMVQCGLWVWSHNSSQYPSPCPVV